jgi:hypothetical protein
VTRKALLVGLNDYQPPVIGDSCHSGTINKDVTETEVPRVVLVPPEIQARIAAKVARRNEDHKAYVAAEYRRLTRELSPERLDARVADIGGGARQERAQTVRDSLQPLFSREEMRHIVDKDPKVGPQLRQLAKERALKDLFEA